MKVKIDRETTSVRPFGVITRIADHKVCIPKSFILNKETFTVNEDLELEDWFYKIYIEPFQQKVK